MKAPRIRIEDRGSGKHIVQNTHVYVVTENEWGEEREVEISNLVRRVAVDMRVGEPLVATLEVFIQEFGSRAEVAEVLAIYLQRPPWWRRLIRRFPTSVSTFNASGVREYYE